jgi:hypothetical protein
MDESTERIRKALGASFVVRLPDELAAAVRGVPRAGLHSAIQTHVNSVRSSDAGPEFPATDKDDRA